VQDGSAADVDATIGQETGDAFGRGAQLKAVTDGEQDDITWEAMT
jgi:hypothetical protein